MTPEVVEKLLGFLGVGFCIVLALVLRLEAHTQRLAQELRRLEVRSERSGDEPASQAEVRRLEQLVGRLLRRQQSILRDQREQREALTAGGPEPSAASTQRPSLLQAIMEDEEDPV